MTRIGFYHLVRSPLEQALPKLLEKIVGAGHRVVVVAGSAERVGFLDNLLWTYEPESWLPHGTNRDGEAALQPVFLTDAEDNPNQADVLVLTDGVVPDQLDAYERCLTLFDGNDEQAVAIARSLWKEWKDGGWELTYYQQTEQGAWQEKAKANAAEL
jgi:DNA polymerase-3 subunit chi